VGAARGPHLERLTAAEIRQFKPKVFLAGADPCDPEAGAAKLPRDEQLRTFEDIYIKNRTFTPGGFSAWPS
jgi:hypothetical protein